MAKIKNRDQRKRKSVRKANQKLASQPIYYDGYMQIPLDPSLSNEELKRSVIYQGKDWSNYDKRCEILNEPRIFKTTAHVYNLNGDVAVATVDYQETGSRKTLAEVSMLAFRAARDGCGAIDMKRSTIVIRAQKDETKAPKKIDTDTLASNNVVLGASQPYVDQPVSPSEMISYARQCLSNSL